jgi:hypothetical protein
MKLDGYQNRTFRPRFRRTLRGRKKREQERKRKREKQRECTQYSYLCLQFLCLVLCLESDEPVSLGGAAPVGNDLGGADIAKL